MSTAQIESGVTDETRGMQFRKKMNIVISALVYINQNDQEILSITIFLLTTHRVFSGLVMTP